MGKVARANGRARRVGAALLLAWLALAGPAAAQPDAGPCDEPTDRAAPAVMPAVGAGGVPLDAVIRVDHPPGGVPEGLDEPLVELREAGSGTPVAGRTSVLADRWVFFVPEAPLRPSTAYEGVARGLDGDVALAFRTGTSFDARAPGPVRIERVVVRREQVWPDCGPPEPGYVFSVTFSPAEDDGPPTSVEYLLHQSRGAGLQAPVLRARTRGFAGGRLTMGFSLTDEEAADPLCLTVTAVDGVGHVSAPSEPFCLDAAQQSYFVGACSVGPARPGSRGILWLLVPLLGRVGRRRRRPSRRR